jgi:hypothetical protein
MRAEVVPIDQVVPAHQNQAAAILDRGLVVDDRRLHE